MQCVDTGLEGKRVEVAAAIMIFASAYLIGILVAALFGFVIGLLTGKESHRKEIIRCSRKQIARLCGTKMCSRFLECYLCQENAQETTQKSDRECILELLGEIPNWLTSPNIQRVDWLNNALQLKWWPHLQDLICFQIRQTFEPVLEKYKPRGVKSVGFRKLTLGDVAPVITGVHYLPTSDIDEIVLEFGVTWTSHNADICIGLHMRSTHRTFLEFGIDDLQLHGSCRLRIKPVRSRMPFFGAFSLSFLRKPVVDFSLNLRTGIEKVPLEISSIPGLSSWLQSTVRNTVNETMVFPQAYYFPLTWELEERDPKTGDVVHRVADSEELQKRYNLHWAEVDQQGAHKNNLAGILVVHVLQAVGLKKYSFRKPNPFVLFRVRDSEKIRSETLSHTVDPSWNERHHIVVESIYQELQLAVFDECQFWTPANLLRREKRQVQKYKEWKDKTGDSLLSQNDTYMGSASIPVATLPSNQWLDRWVDLYDTPSVQIHLRLKWKPFHEASGKEGLHEDQNLCSSVEPKRWLVSNEWYSRNFETPAKFTRKSEGSPIDDEAIKNLSRINSEYVPLKRKKAKSKMKMMSPMPVIRTVGKLGSAFAGQTPNEAMSVDSRNRIDKLMQRNLSSITMAGLLVVNIIKGHNLLFRNDSMNAYCQIFVKDQGRLVKYKTGTVRSKKDPMWNEKFEILVASPNTAHIHIVVWDRQITRKEYVGEIQCPVAYINDGEVECAKSSHVIWELEKVSMGKLEMEFGWFGATVDSPGPSKRSFLNQSSKLELMRQNRTECLSPSLNNDSAYNPT